MEWDQDQFSPTIPEKFKDYLEGLFDSEADRIWQYLDENPNAIHEMIKVIADAHPSIH